MLTVVQDESSGEEPGRPGSLIDEIVREGARRMLAATVRHRTKVTKGPGSRAAGLAMAFKLIESAQERWRAVNAPRLVGLVRAGTAFVNGKLAERPAEAAA